MLVPSNPKMSIMISNSLLDFKFILVSVISLSKTKLFGFENGHTLGTKKRRLPVNHEKK